MCSFGLLIFLFFCVYGLNNPAMPPDSLYVQFTKLLFADLTGVIFLRNGLKRRCFVSVDDFVTALYPPYGHLMYTNLLPPAEYFQYLLIDPRGRSAAVRR